MRRLYILLLRLHPVVFRRRFGDEMLGIFDEMPGNRVGLLWDGLVSVCRQHFQHRPGREAATAGLAITHDASGAPVFFCAAAEAPLWNNLVRGGACSLALFAVVGLGLSVSKPRRARAGFGVDVQRRSVFTPAISPTRTEDLAGAVTQDSGRQLPLASGAEVGQVLASQLDRYSVLALGEWHGAEADSQLRLSILRTPEFTKKASFVAMECACTGHQPALDRYVAGEEIPRDQLQAVWRDVSTPGACDSPVYEQLLTAVRDLNRSLPPDRRIRVLATDPIDWSQIHNRQDWLAAASGRHTVAAEVVSGEIQAGRKGMLVYGGAHLWRNTLGLVIPDDQTLIAQLDAAHPWRTFTVMRHHGANASSERLALMLAGVKPPVLLPLRGTLFGQLQANDILGAGIPVKLFARDVPLRAATDAFVYSGLTPDTRVAATERDAMYTALKKARLALISPAKKK